MANLRGICIFNKFRPYFPLIRSYNPEHFQHCDWRDIRNNVFVAICTTLIIAFGSILVIFGVWHLIENRGDLEKIMIPLGMMIPEILLECTLIALILKNRRINDTINGLQQVIDKRETKLLFNSIALLTQNQ